MAITQTEIDDAKDLFAPVGRIRTRKMMGGLMIYADDLPFALYDSDSGYFLKVDDITVQISRMKASSPLPSR